MTNGRDRLPIPDDFSDRLLEHLEPLHILSVENFGVWNPNIKQAAELVVVDMWFSGEIEGVNEPEDFDGNTSDPRLKAALAETITTFEERLSSAIDSGRMNTSAIQRDLDDRLIPEKTHIHYRELLEWMNERNLGPGEHMLEWADDEETLSHLICNEVAFLRDARASGNEEFVRINQLRYRSVLGLLDENVQPDEVQAALKAKDIEIFRLKKELALCQSGRPAKVDRPLHKRQRRTLLTMIAALCDHAGIDYTARGAAQRIKDATELVGTPIDDGTILTLLNEIPDALESRMN